MLLYRFALGNSKTREAEGDYTFAAFPTTSYIHGEHGIQLIAPEKQTFL